MNSSVNKSIAMERNDFMSKLWCYGMSEKGKFHDALDEKWEAIEQGEEMARYEGLTHFFVGIINGENVVDIERIEVKKIQTEDEEPERMDVSELNSKYKRPRYHPSSVINNSTAIESWLR